MKSLALIGTCIAFPLIANCIEPSPQVTTTEEDSRINFAGMMWNTIGLTTTLNLNGYGCYCGLGNDVDVQPVDATDSCCMTHDYAWMGAKDVAPGCDCNNQDYDYNTRGGTITCAANQSACAAYCCAADKAFSQCIAANPPGQARRYDRTQCEPFECKVDGDCEAGTYCSSNRCVPFCGGGEVCGVPAVGGVALGL